MKQLSLVLIAFVAIGILNSCDNAKLEAMKIGQIQMVDSLATAEIAKIKAQLKEDCDASVEEAIKTKVDSVQAVMASGKKPKTSSSSKSAKPTTTTTTSKPKPPKKQDLKDLRRRNNNKEEVMGSGGSSKTGTTTTAPSEKRKNLKDLRRRNNNGGN